MKALAAPFTVNTMPENTLKAFADHGEIGAPMRPTAAIARRCWRFTKPASISMRWRRRLQDEGAKAFVNSWNELMGVIASKSAALEKVG